ncbi:retrovirus-related pol polyprotein from transposon TNT 1-94 [Tanacetum coccineum]
MNEIKIHDCTILILKLTPSQLITYYTTNNLVSPSQSPQYRLIHPTQHYSTTYPSTPHAITYPSTPHPISYSSTIHQDACPQPQSIPQIEYTVSIFNQQTYLAKFPQIDSGLIVPVFKQGDDPIDPLTKCRVTVQPVQGRQSSFASGTSGTRLNFRIAKRKEDATWFRDKVLLVEAQGSGKVLIGGMEFWHQPLEAAECPIYTTVITQMQLNSSKYFGKHFVPQRELSDEQALQPNTDQSTSSPVKIEAPWELPKVSLVNTSLKKLKYHLDQFDNVVQKRIMPNALTEGEWGVKKDIDEIETINIELEHRVTKLIAENEHLKPTYKQLYDSIKPSRIQAKEHSESLVNQLNQKSVEITNLNAQLQEKVFVITALKNDLRKFKEKYIVDNATQALNATTIALGMNKLNLVTLAPKDKNNRETHIYYLKHTMEQAAILREIVEQAKSLNPLDSASYSACKYVKLIQELLGYVRDTCPDIYKPSEKLVAVMLINKKKTVSSMFDARHELCFLEFVYDMNASSNLRRTFTLVRNACPLTRITATNKVPLREPIPLKVIAQESVVTKVYTRRPKVPKTNGSNSKPKIAKSMISNKMEPSTSRGSNISIALSSSSSVDLRLSKLSCGIWTPDAPSTSLEIALSLPFLFTSFSEKLYHLHMDLYGLMRVASINGKKYILIIVDDYSWFTWVKFIASKDKAPDLIIKFLKMIQVRLNTLVRNICTDNGTEFVNQTLRSYYECVGIYHETLVARSLQQNGVVERRNRTLVEAAQTMLIYAKAPLFLWAEAIATACYTQNRSIIQHRHGKLLMSSYMTENPIYLTFMSLGHFATQTMIVRIWANFKLKLI